MQITLGLFDKHGIKQAGFWTTAGVDDDKLMYFFRWESKEELSKWEAFKADPEWEEKRSRTELPENGGPIVKHIDSVFMVATPYSTVQ
jgi:hypothetical protein